MDTDHPATNDSTPPEEDSGEPAPAVPTNETTPVWAHDEPHEADAAPQAEGLEAADEDEPAAPAARMTKGDPDWSKPESSANGEGAKSGPQWAQTVPTSPGEESDEAAATADPVAETVEPVAAETVEPVAETVEPVAAETVEPVPAETVEPVAEKTVGPEHAEPEPVTESPEPAPAASAADAPPAPVADPARSTWPPAAEAAPAPPSETDIWPPEPPTEKSMPAWPPPSELEIPETSAQQTVWPDSFEDVGSAASAPPAPTPPTLIPERKAEPVATPIPPAAPTPAAPVASAPTVPPAAPVTSRPTPPTLQPEPIPAPAPEHPVEPARSGSSSRPSWAPGPVAEPVHEAAKQPPSPMQVPAWAPRVPLASEPGTPTWFSPKEAIPHAANVPTSQPAAAPAPQQPHVASTPPGGGKLPVVPVPAPAAAQPAKGAWEVVEQKHQASDRPQGPTAEDRSYAEWFAWAKRGGAPASACHAAAQGAFKALASGKDVTTAVQWATAAMSRPPEHVSYTRQTYCAWFSLATIELNLDQHQSHAFATAALAALDAGRDAAAAHAAGLAAAGIR